MRRDGSGQHHCQVLDFFASRSIVPGRAVRYQLRVRLENSLDDPEMVGAQRTPRLRDLHDSVSQQRRFYLSRSPRELDANTDIPSGEIVTREVHQLCCNGATLKVFKFPEG